MADIAVNSTMFRIFVVLSVQRSNIAYSLFISLGAVHGGFVARKLNAGLECHPGPQVCRELEGGLGL